MCFGYLCQFAANQFLLRLNWQNIIIIMIHFSLLIIRLGEALSDSEIEKNENACAGRRSSTGTSGLILLSTYDMSTNYSRRALCTKR